MLILQVVVAAVLIAGAVAALSFEAQHDGQQNAESRSLAAAESFADAPGTEAALRSGAPTGVLQSHVEEARHGSGVDFVSVMRPSGVRLADSDRTLIGLRAEGVERAASGKPSRRSSEETRATRRARSSP